MMNIVFHRCCRAQNEPASDSVVLPYERRERPRQRVVLESGREAGVVLPRGTVMRGGDRLASSCGITACVVAAPEPVSTVHRHDPRELARIAYHLGNRHVALEVGAGWVRYLRDHVLDDMVRGLGAEVHHEIAPFEPEAGAYASASTHPHTHRHSHPHPRPGPHTHAHPHPPGDPHGSRSHD